MNRSIIDRVADAVLYEGYILYPFRPSVKNRQRWTFGGLYPEAYSLQTAGSEPSCNQTECLVRGDAETTIEVVVRFLHLTARQIGQFDPPIGASDATETTAFRPVEELRVDGRVFHTWQEAEEREVAVAAMKAQALERQPHRQPFSFPGRQWRELIEDDNGNVASVIAREQQELAGEIEVSIRVLKNGVFRLHVGVRNTTSLSTPSSRDDALMRTLVSTHILLGVGCGEFVSLLDPPKELRDAADDCRNVGVWPVLVGEEGDRGTMLSSPIILYDYPQIAPESPGDLFDGTEIDEILSLRVLTLTEEEKGLVGAVDERARNLLARTEALGADELFGLHGVMRSRHEGKP